MTHQLVQSRAITALVIGMVFLVQGCASAQNVSNSSTDGISQLEISLQEQGIFVLPRGPANLDIPAEQSSRLVLDSQEVLNVFEFESDRRASGQAHAFAGAHPGHDVYLKGRLVAVRQSSGDTGLAQTLRSILGEAL